MSPIAPQAARGWCPGALKPMETGDGLLARVRALGRASRSRAGGGDRGRRARLRQRGHRAVGARQSADPGRHASGLSPICMRGSRPST